MMKNVKNLLRIILYPYLIFLCLCFEYNLYLIDRWYIAPSSPTPPKKLLLLGDHIERYNKKIDFKHIAKTIVYESKKSNFDALYVAAIVRHESGFKSSIRSSANAYGLMQIKPCTAKYIANRSGLEWKGVDYLNNPAYNIQIGIAYLKYLQTMFKGNKTKALMAYNWGPGNLIKNPTIPKQVYNYAHVVNTTHKQLLKEFNTYE